MPNTSLSIPALLELGETAEGRREIDAMAAEMFEPKPATADGWQIVHAGRGEEVLSDKEFWRLQENVPAMVWRGRDFTTSLDACALLRAKVREAGEEAMCRFCRLLADIIEDSSVYIFDLIDAAPLQITIAAIAALSEGGNG